ncbi:exosome complex component MTR3-like [Epargyreus clarus]|uniref:exosome complex component MTR3-like n=1 Tax=Epargyreus clarus TaxID=520877 RepID=UPI003C30884F
MPLDYRRNNAPENSISYKCFTKEFKKSKEELYKDLFDENGLRKDGRAPDDVRSLCRFLARVDTVSQAKGSSYVESKNTKVTCSVFEPREIPHQTEFRPLGQLYVEFKFAPFSCPRKRRPYVPDSEEKALSAAVKKALEPAVCRQAFPNHQVDIYIYILEHDGGCLAAAINAAGLALADAVIPMYDIITACSVAVINDQLFLDPSEAEEHLALRSPLKEGANHGLVTMSTLCELNQVTDFRQIGSMDVELVTNIMEILEKECANLMPIIRKILVASVVKNIERKKVWDAEKKQREEVMNAKLEEWKRLLNSNN